VFTHRDKELNHPDRTKRKSRGYEINGQWYFELRNGGQKGPYASKEEMQAELDDFIKSHALMNQEN